MLRRVASHLTYANVISTVCLFILLGGSAYAATTGSIDSREVKNNTLRSGDILDGTVRSSDIRDHTILSRDVKNGVLKAEDFQAGQLPAGKTGPAGPQGPAGKDGVDGTGGGGGGGGALETFGGYTRTDVPQLVLGDGESRVLLTKGPFTVTAACDLQTEAGADIATTALATASDNQTLVYTAGSGDSDFDVAESPRGLSITAAQPGAPAVRNALAHAFGSDGTTIETHLVAGTNLFGTPGCHFDGYIDSK